MNTVSGDNAIKLLAQIARLEHERDQLRGNLSLAEEGLANATQEIQRLQRALHFWLPHVPADGPEEIAKRCGDDAMLLVGFDPTDPVELDAEARGWIELQVPAQIRQLCPECLGYMPCAQHPTTEPNSHPDK